MVLFDGSENVIADVAKTELAEAGATDAANTLTLSTRSLAANERRECRFRATWLHGDRVLGSHAWRAGESDTHTQQQMDGSLQGLLIQAQRHIEQLMRLNNDRESRAERVNDRQIAQLEKRNAALEARVEELAGLLRERSNTEDEIAAQEAAAEIEGRARRQEILYARALPMLDALLARYLQQHPPPTAAPESTPAESAPNGKPNG